MSKGRITHHGSHINHAQGYFFLKIICRTFVICEATCYGLSKISKPQLVKLL